MQVVLVLLSILTISLAFPFEIPFIKSSPLQQTHWKNEALNQNRREEVKRAFKHAWSGYRKYAWGHDELRPNTDTPADPRNGWGATILDSLDTLIIMGLDEELKEAREHVANLDWRKTKYPIVQVFETNIRYLGGLLSAYDLTGDRLYLEKARELADLLMPCFESETGIPYQNVDIRSGRPVKSGLPNGSSDLAEMGTLQLELAHLSHLTRNYTYYEKAKRVVDILEGLEQPYPGLYPIFINPTNGDYETNYITIGGGGDSFYEYLFKMYLYEGKSSQQYRSMYEKSMDTIENLLLVKTANRSDLVQLSSIRGNQLIYYMDELSCFLPGNLLLASKVLNNKRYEKMAADLLKTCVNAWTSTATGIAPESWYYVESTGKRSAEFGSLENQHRAETWGFWPSAPFYILRPETIESLFYFYRLTGDTQYQDVGWKIFKSIDLYCKTPSGFSGLNDVTRLDGGQNNNQESFFFAETLKYLYLLFSPDTIPLDKWVFNTEAHPFRIPN
ncbi:uncharacterized protein VTP21DRAFT_9445 [Calcarisporiella thermophila]|uniref:uncharacterized protein n=1 Tax=Calcarisporiella thermophila TaxID=911321 RepID=UPI0037426BB5